MKYLAFLLITLFTPLIHAESMFKFNPTVTVGFGVEVQRENSYGSFMGDVYLFQVGDDQIGLHLLGIGASVNAKDQWGVTVSPMCYYMARVCVGPRAVFSDGNANFGVGLQYRF